MGVYVGEGSPPVPSKLAEKVRRWEYLEMSELLPEFWSKADDSETMPSTSRRRRHVTESYIQ